jgi:hypothetical protein
VSYSYFTCRLYNTVYKTGAGIYNVSASLISYLTTPLSYLPDCFSINNRSNRHRSTSAYIPMILMRVS